MSKHPHSLFLSVLLCSGFLVGCSSGSSTSATATSEVSVRFSDAPVESAKKVVIKVDQIIFKQEGEDIIVDSFTSSELNDGLGVEDVDSFQIDLLEVQGFDNRLVLDTVSLPIGEYQDLRIVVLDEDVNDSYVLETDDEQKPIKVPSNQLKLGAFEVVDDSQQTLVIEFGLRQALTYNPGPDRYILKPRGVRVVGLEQASSIAGTVDLSEIHLDPACSSKPDSSVGNVAYLYSGHDLDPTKLGDVFIRSDDSEDPEFDSDVADDIIQPYAATEVDGSSGDYLFSYLPPGDFTVAFSCNAESDDPIIYDGLVIPEPDTIVVEIALPAETNAQCDLPTSGTCSIIE